VDRHTADQIKQDAANAKNRICPETGRKVEKGAALSHVAEVFPRYLTADPKSDYARRARLVLAMDDAPDKE
jgi:hypothetical protein